MVIFKYRQYRRSRGFFGSRPGALNRSRRYWCHSIENFYIYLGILFVKDRSSSSKVMRRSVDFCQIFESEYLSREWEFCKSAKPNVIQLVEIYLPAKFQVEIRKNPNTQTNKQTHFCPLVK